MCCNKLFKEPVLEMPLETEVQKTYTYGDYLRDEADHRWARRVMYLQAAGAALVILFYISALMRKD